jgi:putative lipoprotein
MIDAFKPDANGTVKVMMQRVKAAPTSSNQGKAQASLTNTYWKLMTLAGKPADIGAGGRELRLQLVEKDTRYHGFSGCNNYNGGYSLKPGNGLELGPAAGTRKACMEGMEQEHAYLQMLDRVSSYAIEGESLRLLDADGAELATFESRYMQ